MKSSYEDKLLQGWEEVFRKAQLAPWIMLALKDGPKHMAAIKRFIHSSTGGAVSADDQSYYRALRRYHRAQMLEYVSRPGQSGPDRKVYHLSAIGERVLREFLKRNFTDVFYRPVVKKLIVR